MNHLSLEFSARAQALADLAGLEQSLRAIGEILRTHEIFHGLPPERTDFDTSPNAERIARLRKYLSS